MNPANGSQNGHGATVLEEHSPSLEKAQSDTAAEQASLATRTGQRARQQFKQNRFVIVAAGGLVFALLILAFASAPRLKRGNKSINDARATAQAKASQSAPPTNESLFPVIDSGRPAPAESHDGELTEQDLDRTVTRRAAKTYGSAPPAAGVASPGSLGSIPPFGEQAWQAPPYQPGISTNAGMTNTNVTRIEREPEVKASLVFVRNVSTTAASSEYRQSSETADRQFGLGLAVGSRLRARLESAASTAVRTPVLAVIEYNYERDGEIVVPAGSKAVGHIQEADRSGYVRIEFDSLLMPDGSSVSIQAAATDLDLRPIKGKVEGKNTGKNVLMRSLSGIGQAGALLVGRGSLNQPFSESDVIRERVSSNIGEAGDEQISRLAITSRVVVNISAGTPIYVVLEQSSKQVRGPAQLNPQAPQTLNQTNIDKLRQLLQLQQELNQSAARTETVALPQNQ
ncbi:MAG TPA: TrbI/VirB10 family protein [Candidatus Angelobacter sp.]|nr:TrbI/VirB10 family protein [Candidatus Angelobacter sp.]